MAQDETHAPRPEQAETTKPAKRGQSKPLTLHPLTVEEALKRTFAAGPLPKKPRKTKARGTKAKKEKRHDERLSGR